MKKIYLFIALVICLPVYPQQTDNVLHISKDIDLIKISDDVYIHKSFTESDKWGRISANGMVYVDKKKAFLFDTPWNDAQTEKLIRWLKDSLNVNVVGFVPNHWHEDCMGGLGFIKSKKIKSYANQMTMDIAKEKGLPVPEVGFRDSLILHLGKKEIFCFYPGAAHTLDNIVVWLPAEKVLFAGCVLKGMKSKNLGFTDDGDVKEYPDTLNKLLVIFSDAKIVIPGHGNYGGPELIWHNMELTNIKSK